MRSILVLFFFSVLLLRSEGRVIINLLNYTTPAPLLPASERINQAYSSAEERLLRFLFKDYNPNIMPRQNLNESFKLYIGLAMSQLINIYDKEQVMKTNVWIHMWWIDPFLQWSHIEEYNHIVSIRVPYEKVWTPDIILFNNAHGKYDVSYKSNVVLYQQGGLLWIPPAIYKSSCQINVKYFPFDQQVCEMIFGSWVYNSDELTLDYFENMRNVDLHDYVPSGTWGLIEVPASIEYYNDTNTNKTKAQMIYKIKMRRKSRFYIVNIIIPTFLLSLLSVCVFYLPTDDGEKITLSLSILFAIVVFFLLIAKIIPPTSIVVPLISKYLLFTFIMNIMSVLNTCIVINLYYKRLSLEHLPDWLNCVLFRILPRLLLLNHRKQACAAATRERLASLSVQQHHRHSSTATASPGSSFSIPKASIDETHLRKKFSNEFVFQAHLPPPFIGQPSPPATRSVENNRLFLSATHKNRPINDAELLARRFDSANDLLLVSSGLDDGNNIYRHVLLRARESGDQSIGMSTSERNLSQSQRIPPPEPIRIPTTPKMNSSINEMPKSQLYNIDKLMNRSSQIRKRQTATTTTNMQYGIGGGSLRLGERIFEWGESLERRLKEDISTGRSKKRIESKRASFAKKTVSIDSIKLTERFINVCRAVDYIANIMKAKAQLDEIKEDWKFVASMIDRLMLIIFFVITCIGTYYFLFDAPHLFEKVDEQALIRMNSHKLATNIR